MSRLFDQQLVQARFRRRQENAIGIIFQTFIAAENTDQLIYFIVVRFNVFVADGPIVAQAIYAASFKILWTEAEGNPSPVVGAAAHHAGAEPIPARAAFVGIWFA